ncbi:MAG: T9SS type A sorting domain-containing protein, partial [Bacteroidales bacterium]|nr:T9SS type A sorting domain-containing protein [Bacteroidales bacterium]
IVYINVLLSIGVDEYYSKINIYPNPATKFINIVQENTDFEQLTVYDITGRIVIQKSLNNSSTSLDISNLPSGVYLISLKTVNSSIEKRVKFVKK